MTLTTIPSTRYDRMAETHLLLFPFLCVIIGGGEKYIYEQPAGRWKIEAGLYGMEKASCIDT